MTAPFGVRIGIALMVAFGVGLCWISVAAAADASPIRQIDINAAGQTLATLNDWRAIMFVVLIIAGALILLVFALVGVVVWLAGRRSANDRATLAALTENTRTMADHAASLRSMEDALSRLAGEQLP